MVDSPARLAQESDKETSAEDEGNDICLLEDVENLPEGPESGDVTIVVVDSSARLLVRHRTHTLTHLYSDRALISQGPVGGP